LLSADIGEIFRREHGRAVAVLTRQLGDIALAEEAVQEAFTTALEHWPRDGTPPAPAGWIITTARNRAIDRLRREASRGARHEAAMQMLEPDDNDHDVNDEHLRLIFTCCHPAIALESQIALTLRLLCGMSTAEIARAFLVSEATLAQRLSRAKSKIRAAGIPYRVPDAEELPERLRSVLAVVYLVFNEGYSASAGDELLRPALIEDAMRLGRLLHELLPGDGEVAGLLALMLLIDARRPARLDDSGAVVRLAEQDRSRWDRARITEGQALLRECLARNRPGPYQLQAAINAVHADAGDARSTDWVQILALYDQLMALTPNAVIALNRAVVIAEVHGPEHALRLVEELDLPEYPWLHAVKADLLRRIGQRDAAARSYQAAIRHCTNGREREYLERQCAALRG
jgi:RNA polymerase sigma-70 factor (ECF subfamily)